MTKITGIQRKVEQVQIEVDSFALMEACKEGLSNKDFVELLRDKVFNIIRSCSPELQDRKTTLTEFSGRKVWMVEDGYDCHKGETLWKSVRDATDQELGLLAWCDSFKEILDFHENLVTNNKGDK